MITEACRVLELLREGRSATVPKLVTDFAIDEDDVMTLNVARTPLRDDGFSLRAGDSVLGIDGDPREFVGAAEFLLALRGRSGNVPLRVLRNGREEVLNTALVPSLRHVGRRGLAISGVVFAARKLAEIVRLSRTTRSVLWQNIVLAIGIKAVFLVLTMTGHATLWMAVFADMGTSLLVVFNGMRLLRHQGSASSSA
jgi:hypothetical protein